jgi:hypothetical protein
LLQRDLPCSWIHPLATSPAGLHLSVERRGLALSVEASLVLLAVLSPVAPLKPARRQLLKSSPSAPIPDVTRGAKPTWSPPGLSEEQQAELEAQHMHRDALVAAGAARRAFLCKLLSQRIAKGEVLQHVALVFVEIGNALAWEDYELAGGLLNVAGQEVDNGRDAHDALKPYAARRPEDAARSGLALAFAVSEGFLHSTWSADWSRARIHLGFLERHGYVLSEVERQELDQATAEEDTEAEAGK